MLTLNAWFDRFHSKRVKLICLITALVLCISSLPLSVSAAQEPSIGSSRNAAEYMTVINNGTDYTQTFKNSGEISVAADTRGFFGNIFFTGDTFNYSADILVSSDYSTYGSIRMVLGACKYKGNTKNIELCVRPSLGGQTVFFLTGNGEDAVSVGNSQKDVKIGTAYHCTVKYENGKISYWVNGVLVFNAVSLPSGVENVMFQPGFYSQCCAGKISNIAIWGDAEEAAFKEFDAEKDANLIYNVPVTDAVSGKTYKPEDCRILSDSNATDRPVFDGLVYSGNTYSLCADAAFGNNTENASVDWEGLIFKVASARKDNKTWQIEVRIRSRIAVVFAVSGITETPILIKGDNPTAFDTYNSYSVYYRANNTFDFWKNDTALFYRFDLTEYGYSDIKPSLSLGGEMCPFEYKNIKLWGDGLSVMCVPLFNELTDTNIIPKVQIENSLNGGSEIYGDCKLSGSDKKTCRFTVKGVTYADNYKFTARAVKYDNKDISPSGSEYNAEGLIFRMGTSSKDGKDCAVEVRARRGGFIVYALWNSGAETVIGEYYDHQSAYGEIFDFAVEYKPGGKFDIWQNGVSVLYNYDVKTHGYSELKPDFGVGGEMCDFEFTDMKLWGTNILVDSTPIQNPDTEPVFNPETDNNVIPLTVISNPVTGVAARSPECKTENSSNQTCRQKFLGIEYFGDYNFNARAVMEDNSENEKVNWEGLVFQIGKSKLDGTDYNIEIRVRSGGVHIFAFANGLPEKVLESYYTVSTKFGEYNAYTLACKKDGKFSFWINGKLIIKDFDIKSKNFSALTPEFSFGSEVCPFKAEDMKLWGDVTVPVAPVFNPETMEDLIPEVVVNDVFSGKLYKLTDRKLVSNSQTTGRVDFSGVKVNGDYTFFADASFENNKNLHTSGKEIDWEDIIFRTAKVKKDKEEYIIEVRVRHGVLLVYAVDSKGAEKLLLNKQVVTEFGKKLSYVLDFSDGKFDLWQDNVKLLDGFDVTEYGYSDVSAYLGIGCEVCSFAFENMRLVNRSAGRMPNVPPMPQSNGNYADVTDISGNSLLSYKDGTLICSDDKTSAKAVFGYLPFDADDTYVFGSYVTVERAEKNWMGPRFIVGVNKNGEEIALFFTASELIVAEGSQVVKQVQFKREIGTKYRIDILIEPERLSVWLDGILFIDSVATSAKSESRTGVLFENAKAVLSGINIYYTSPTKFVVPKKPEKPVLKRLADGQYNAAEYAKVTLSDKDFGGYFNCTLYSTDSSNGLKYLYKELPISDSQSFYFSSQFKVTESSEVWKGPRYIFRKSDEKTMYCAVTQKSLLILADGEVAASTPFELEIGKQYEIVIYSTPDKVSVWLDGALMFENVDLSEYASRSALRVKPGILFELCQARVSDIAIYGDGIVFDPDYVDMELYNDSLFKMSGVPSKAAGAKNLFTNIKMIDNSSGSLGAVFDSEARAFRNDYDDVKDATVKFVDADGSSNLNGLKNGSSYVFSFKYKPSAASGENPEDSGMWFICNNSTAPWLKEICSIKLGFFGNTIKLNTYKDGVLQASQAADFKRVIGREYQVDMVHGRNWIKLYIDGELTLVGTDLPIYNVCFNFGFDNIACDITGFNLYEAVDTGLEILENKENPEVSRAGNSVLNAQQYDIKTDTEFPVAVIVILTVLVAVSGFVGISLLVRKKKNSGK